MMLSYLITGPTASGKSDLSYRLAAEQPSEIINIDSRQIYTPLSVGTAKPTILTEIPHHLFNLYEVPTEISAMQFRKLVQVKVKEIVGRGNCPIIVGGSSFYIKSLFYPPCEFPKTTLNTANFPDLQLPDTDRWQLLNKIDPVRAKELHPNDLYRINRALNIQFQHGVLPSACKPKYDSIFDESIEVKLITIAPARDLLRERIAARLNKIFRDWVVEVEALLSTPWEPFWEKHGIIGYSEIARFIRNGKLKSDISATIQSIFYKTCRYAKYQSNLLPKISSWTRK